MHTTLAVAEDSRSNECSNAISPNTAASPYSVEHLSDPELLAGTRGLIARSNEQLARLLAHLGEVEARGIHRTRACATLCTYCIYELRQSEDTAFRYARAARLARAFPVVLHHIAAGELHLTGLLQLGPHLTDENHRDVLQRAKHRTKREIAKLVRRLDPLLDVPARIEPLGPAPAEPRRATASFRAFTESLNPVRELPLADRPSQWLHLANDHAAGERDGESAPRERVDDAAAAESPSGEQGGPAASPRDAAPAWLNPQRYSVQFTASQEYVDLFERAKALLSHAVPSRSIEEVHLRAMRLLVAELEKKKFARGRPGSSGPCKTGERETGERETGERETGERDNGAVAVSHGRGDEPPGEASNSPRRRGVRGREWREGQPGRYVPAAVRREVCERDGLRCAYVSENGQRCAETSFLEFHHHDPYARGGAPSATNLALYCRSHNALAAEQDFGRAHMARRSGRE